MTASAKEVISDAIHLPSARKCDEYADAILAALDSAGYVVVPREPTEAMREAARAAPLTRGIGDVGIGGVYRAMIAAEDRDHG